LQIIQQDGHRSSRAKLFGQSKDGFGSDFRTIRPPGVEAISFANFFGNIPPPPVDGRYGYPQTVGDCSERRFLSKFVDSPKEGGYAALSCAFVNSAE